MAAHTGRGRKPAFPPVHASAAAAQEELQHLSQRDPRICGIAQTRWTLASLGKAVFLVKRLNASGDTDHSPVHPNRLEASVGFHPQSRSRLHR